MNSVINQLKKYYGFVKRGYRTYQYNKGSRFKYYNFWTTQSPQEMWLTQFIQSRNILIPNSLKINFTSVLGNVADMNNHRKGINIFYTGENIHTERFYEHYNYVKEHPFDLEIGFDYKGGENYFRFPLWIMWHFDPNSTYEDIKRKVNRMRYPEYNIRNGFCALVCSHDWNGIRGSIISELQNISDVHSAGKYANNTDLLKGKYKDNKVEFLKNYKFNICPENSNEEGYVTEKIFDSMLSGCIPIYWGSNNVPEPNIINPEAVLFWNKDGDNAEVIKVINQMWRDEDLYQQFFRQPRLLMGAEDVIWEMWSDLEKRLRSIICQ